MAMSGVAAPHLGVPPRQSRREAGVLRNVRFSPAAIASFTRRWPSSMTKPLPSSLSAAKTGGCTMPTALMVASSRRRPGGWTWHGVPIGIVLERSRILQCGLVLRLHGMSKHGSREYFQVVQGGAPVGEFCGYDLALFCHPHCARDCSRGLGSNGAACRRSTPADRTTATVEKTIRRPYFSPTFAIRFCAFDSSQFEARKPPSLFESEYPNITS